MPGMPSSQTSPAFDTAISIRPIAIERRAADAVDQVARDEHEAVHADDVRADDREDVAVRVAVADGDVAGEVHHADHHGEARDRREHRGRHAGPAQDLAERRRRRGLLGIRDERLRELLRVGPHERTRSGSPRARRATRRATATPARAGVRSRPANIGPKISGPKIAPETAPKSTNDMPRARRSGGNISAAAARESSTIACAAPQNASPRKTSSPELDQQPSETITGPTIPKHEARADHRHAPDPVGDAPGRADGQRSRDQEDRRPEPEDPLEAGDGDERHRAERDRELDHPREADEPGREHDRVALHRASSRAAARRPRRNSVAPPCAGWRTYAPPSASWATRPTGTTRRPRASSHTNGSPDSISLRLGRRFDASSPGWVGTTFQSRTSLGEPELGEHAVDDGRGRLGRALARELPLRGERDAGDARAAVAGRLGDEQDRRRRALVEVRREPSAQQRRTRAVARRSCRWRRCTRRQAVRRGLARRRDEARCCPARGCAGGTC